LRELLYRYPGDGLSLSNGVLVFKVMDLLIHRFVYLESTFGSKEEFKQLVKKVTYSLMV
jgi:hypothetical protein